MYAATPACVPADGRKSWSIWRLPALPPDHAESLVEWDALARLRGTVVLLMAVQNLPAIAARLVSGGRPASTPVAIVSEGTMPGERTLLPTLGAAADDMTKAAVRPPAIVVVGQVVSVARPGAYAADG